MLKDSSADAVCEVAEMEQDEAVDLLLDAARLRPAPDEVTQLALDIVVELGLLALAVNQAGAFMAQGRSRIQDSLTLFRTHRAELLQLVAYRRASMYDRADVFDVGFVVRGVTAMSQQ